MATWLPISTVDAFTKEPYAGNPAAVCLLSEMLDDSVLLKIAAEMNLSETAYLLKEGENAYWLRWFTPEVEVDLCGHATLASAHTLFQTLPSNELSFRTRSGTIVVKRQGETLEINFPQNPPEPVVLTPQVLTAVLASLYGEETRPSPEEVIGSQFSAKTGKLLLEVASVASVLALRPNFAQLKATAFGLQSNVRGVIVTTRGAGDYAQYDFVSRYFAPWVGINEDPVTGSAHTVLAPYWSARLARTRFLAFQRSARGGQLEVELVGDRTFLRGTASTVLEGRVRLPT